jgi:hypothetical protein
MPGFGPGTFEGLQLMAQLECLPLARNFD